MSAVVPSSLTDTHDLPTFAAPPDLVDEYLRLVEERRLVDERLSYLRAELELLAAPVLSEAAPRGRFVGAGGAIGVRLQPTCVFDRVQVGRELQRMARLADVAILQGPSMARYLAKEPAVAARLGHMVRLRRSIVVTGISP